MKIILTEDVKKLGKRGELVDVSDGYARNYILPKKIGIEATPANLTQLKNRLAKEEHDEALRVEDAQKVADDLNGKKITLGIKAGENGRTFGSITTKEIADAIKDTYNYDIDRKKILLDETIKAIGKYEIEMKIYKDVITKITLEVKNA